MKEGSRNMSRMTPSQIKMSRREMLRLMGIGGTFVIAACAAPSSPAAAPAVPAAEQVESQTAGFQLSAPSFNKDAETVLVFLNAGTSQVESMHQTRWVEQWNRANPDIQV